MALPQDPVQQLWLEYKRTGSLALRNALAERYLPLVDYLAERIAERLPRTYTVAMARSAGSLGLLDAVEGFDPSRGIKFETYCSLRVRGAIQDELRSLDWVPRLIRNRAKKLAVLKRNLRSETGLDPTEDQLAERSGIAPEDLHDALRLHHQYLATDHDPPHHRRNTADGTPADALSAHQDPRHCGPESAAETRDEARKLLGALPRKAREIVRLYHEGLTLKEASAQLGLSESRAAQLHTGSVAYLQIRFAGRCSEDFDPGTRRCLGDIESALNEEQKRAARAAEARHSRASNGAPYPAPVPTSNDAPIPSAGNGAPASMAPRAQLPASGPDFATPGRSAPAVNGHAPERAPRPQERTGADSPTELRAALIARCQEQRLPRALYTGSEKPLSLWELGRLAVGAALEEGAVDRTSLEHAASELLTGSGLPESDKEVAVTYGQAQYRRAGILRWAVRKKRYAVQLPTAPAEAGA